MDSGQTFPEQFVEKFFALPPTQKQWTCIRVFIQWRAPLYWAKVRIFSVSREKPDSDTWLLAQGTFERARETTDSPPFFRFLYLNRSEAGAKTIAEWFFRREIHATYTYVKEHEFDWGKPAESLWITASNGEQVVGISPDRITSTDIPVATELGRLLELLRSATGIRVWDISDKRVVTNTSGTGFEEEREFVSAGIFSVLKGLVSRRQNTLSDGGIPSVSSAQ